MYSAAGISERPPLVTGHPHPGQVGRGGGHCHWEEKEGEEGVGWGWWSRGRGKCVRLSHTHTHTLLPHVRRTPACLGCAAKQREMQAGWRMRESGRGGRRREGEMRGTGLHSKPAQQQEWAHCHGTCMVTHCHKLAFQDHTCNTLASAQRFLVGGAGESVYKCTRHLNALSFGWPAIQGARVAIRSDPIRAKAEAPAPPPIIHSFINSTINSFDRSINQSVESLQR